MKGFPIMPEKKKKQGIQRNVYERPGIIYEKKMETLAAMCDSSWLGPAGACCQTGGCVKSLS